MTNIDDEKRRNISPQDCIDWHKRCHIYIQQYYGGDAIKNAATIAYLQDIDRLQSELEACRRDADRYRWLVRNRHGWFYHMLSYHPMKPVCKDTFDESIDAALAATKPTEREPSRDKEER